MAKSTTKGYTNTTAQSAYTLPLVKLSESTNYAIVEDEAGVTLLSNTTANADIAERISVKAQNIAEVKPSQGVLYPSPVKTGVQYSVKVENILSTTDSTDPAYRLDEPIVVTLTVKHNQSATFSDETVLEQIGRAVSALISDDGSDRIGALQRLATRPAAN